MDCYDRQGRPITLDEWSARRRDEAVVAKTDVTDQVHVSTVWLGMDHNWGGVGPLVIFETLIFGGPLDQEMWRYSTEEQARAGHEEAVKQATAARHAEFGEVTTDA